MSASVTVIDFDGSLLKRGFWLYVWEIQTPDRKTVYYVGRTGDSSSSNSQSPFNRMSQHLGFNDKSNVLRRHLKDRGIDPERCTFRLIAYGPILQETSSPAEHRKNRDHIAAMEKALADAMTEAGYQVLNTVDCREELAANAFAEVLAAFGTHFKKLANGQRT
jgi:hypothetical protein